jgi:hypothetical protein
VLRKLKKEIVGKKGVRSDCWYAQVFEPSYQFVQPGCYHHCGAILLGDSL